MLGPSGCGKSTTLRMIAGLEALSEGELDIEGQDMDGVAPRDRDVAMVFQNYALYPTMNVRDNIEFGLKNAKVPKAEREHRIREVCDMTGLTEYLRRKPGALSGGQRQRVALARAMVKHPSIFLMDEPLSNLDAKLRSQLRSDLIELHHKMNATFIYVTHDQIEAMSMGTDIVLMNQGKIMQQGSPEEIYRTPQNVFTARFIGSPAMNVFPCSQLNPAGKPENAAYVACASGASFHFLQGGRNPGGWGPCFGGESVDPGNAGQRNPLQSGDRSGTCPGQGVRRARRMQRHRDAGGQR